MIRFVACGLAAALLALGGTGAPVPKETADEPADLKALHALIARAVKDGKRLSAEDDKKARDILRRLVERVAKEASLGDRKLPVDWDAVKRTDVVKEWRMKQEDDLLIVAGELRGFANNSIILASGDVSLNTCENSIVVGRKVQFTSASNSIIVAEEYLRGTVTENAKDVRKGCILVSGRWIRMNKLDSATCLVTHPNPAVNIPDGPFDDTIPVRMTSSRDVVFLNSTAHLELDPRWKFRIVEPKKPIAK